MLGPALVRGDERQVDLGLLGARQLDLAFSAASFKRCNASLSLRRSMPFSLQELACEVIDKPHVEVFAAKNVSPLVDLTSKTPSPISRTEIIEGAAAEVVNRDVLDSFFLIEAVGQRCRRGLVDDAQNLKPRDLPGVLGCLALGVVEVSWNSDDRFFHLLAKVSFGGSFIFCKMKAEILRRRVFLAVAFDPGIAIVAANDLVGTRPMSFSPSRRPAAPDQALDGEKVFSGLVTAWRFAGRPIKRSPSAVKATMGRCRAHAYPRFR